jgi:uncharacterized protein YgbK (DUF1537 family)
MRIGIVADDLTGAMDSAAPFADRGLATRVLLSVAGDQAGPDPDVLAIDTHSRDLGPDAAAHAVQAGIARIGADRLPFKKIDSTLRGNVAAEIAAAMQASGCTCALVAPAAPAQGRVLRNGYLIVDGQKVGAVSLVDTLRRALPGLPVHSLRAGDPLRDEPHVLVADAENEHDLARIAAFGLAHRGKVLLVGSSGLASALVDQLRPARVQRAHPGYERLLFVVGSHNMRSAEQVRKLLALPSVATLVLTPGGEVRRAAADQGDARIALLQVEGLGARPTLDPRWVASRLADVTADVLAIEPAPTALFMTGGDTARAILSRLHVQGIDVIGNLYPGIVHGRVTVAKRPVGVITKAGGFGGADLLVNAAADLVLAAH